MVIWAVPLASGWGVIVSVRSDPESAKDQARFIDEFGVFRDRDDTEKIRAVPFRSA